MKIITLFIICFHQVNFLKSVRDIAFRFLLETLFTLIAYGTIMSFI